MKRKIFVLSFFAAFISYTEFSVRAQWVQLNEFHGKIINCLTKSGNMLFAATNGDGVFLSIDNGENWSNIGLSGQKVDAISVSDTNLLAVASGAVFFSSDYGKSWEARNNGLSQTTVLCLSLIGTNIFVGTSGEVTGPTSRGIFRSNDNGLNWTVVYQLYTPYEIHAIAATDGFIVAGMRSPPDINAGVLFSDYNSSWAHIGLSNESIFSFAIRDTTIFAGSNLGVVYRSTNKGRNWDSLITDPVSTTYVDAIIISDTNIFAATYGNGVYRSTNDGLSWVPFETGLKNSGDRTLMVSNGFLFVGTTFDGIWRRPLTDLANVDKGSDESEANVSLSPNPSTGIGTISYRLNSPNHIKIDVYNAVGQIVEKLFDGFKDEGNHTERFDLTEHSAGTYFICLRTDNMRQVRNLILIK
ncbi:MAG: T9SS type A sorting domain-containing protein [Candidatus Kapaibacterium sp.]